jgi:serine/threonine-protein kinase HipA
MENRCLYCYDLLTAGEIDYHGACTKTFFNQSAAPIIPYAFTELEKLAIEAALQSVTVPGVQPKLSLGWIKNDIEDGHKSRLTIMNALDGQFILKPQNITYPQMPENEHLSMRLAELFKIEVVPSSMIRLKSGELCYLTKRIDRDVNGNKKHMIDFLQIMELEDKYKGSMERLGKQIGELSENTLLDKLRFFELAVFNYVIGNNDMHLKNFSMLLSNIGWVLSPAYDLLNVKIILPEDKEDTAIMLGGKKMNFNKQYFDRFAEVLKLNKKQIGAVYKRLDKWIPKSTELINKSFLSKERKAQYTEQINLRGKLFIK